MTKNILFSLIASCAVVAAVSLPVSAAQHEGHHGHHETHKHHATTHESHGTKHHTLQHLEHGHPAHSIKTDLEAKGKASNAKQQHKVHYRVTASKLCERTEPNVHSHKVGTLKKGTLVEVKELSHDGKWALCHTGTWVSTKYLEKNSEKHHGTNHLGDKVHAGQTSHMTHGVNHNTHNTHGLNATHGNTHGTHNTHGNHSMNVNHGTHHNVYGTYGMNHSAYGSHYTHGVHAYHGTNVKHHNAHA